MSFVRKRIIGIFLIFLARGKTKENWEKRSFGVFRGKNERHACALRDRLEKEAENSGTSSQWNVC